MGSTRTENRKRAKAHVLIPSSSGHGFNQQSSTKKWPRGSLNPFFIRAWVQPDRRPRLRRREPGLNPFFIRAWVQPAARSGHRRGARVLIPSSSGHGFNHRLLAGQRVQLGLNPFFIRAWVQPSRAWGSASQEMRLNPFFIRAWVQPAALGGGPHRIHVLIPSSSGHGFNRRRRENRLLAVGLNPFFIRAWVQPDFDEAELLRRLVLIPSSSGHGFNQMSSKETDMSYGS